MFKDAIKYLVDNNKILKYNPIIAEGVGYAQAKDGIHDKIDMILRREITHSSNNTMLPAGLSYVGYKILSPLEIYAYKLIKTEDKTKRNRRGVVISATDMYMINAIFKVPDPKLDNPGKSMYIYRPLFLVFIRRGGFINSWGTTYHASPVIHAPGICREHAGLFINFDFIRKVTLQYCEKPTKILVNGREEELCIPGSKNFYTQNKSKINALALWIYGKYGFSQGIKKYLDVNVKIIPARAISEVDLDKYTVISSCCDKKQSEKIEYALIVDSKDLPWHNSKVKWTEKEHLLLSMLAVFFKAAYFYISKTKVDPKTNQLTLEPLFSSIDLDNVDESLANMDCAYTWVHVMARMTIGVKESLVKITHQIEKHFRECGRYMNDRFRGELMLNDPSVDPKMDIFDFMFYVIKIMCKSRLIKNEDVASMYDKRLTVIDYLLLNSNGFSSTISKLRWKLEKMVEDQLNGSKKLDSSSIVKLLNNEITVSLVTRSFSSNGVVNPFNASTESMVLAISNHAISQTETDTTSNKNKTVNLSDRTKHTSASHLELGNIYYIPKSSPYKNGILNPYMQLSRNLVMLRNPKLVKVINEVEQDIAMVGN